MRSITAGFLTLLTVSTLAGCGLLPGPVAPARTAATRPTPPPDPKSEMPALEARIAALIEAERLKLDPAAKPLTLDPELTRVARERARDMAQGHYLAHAAPDGQTSATLLMAEDAKFQGLLGENLAAQHYLVQSGVDVDQFAHRFLDEWLKSAPHRDNLAFAAYDRTGVGAAVNGDTVYVTQLFATEYGPQNRPDRDPATGVTTFESPAAATAAETHPPPVRLRGAMGGQDD